MHLCESERRERERERDLADTLPSCLNLDFQIFLIGNWWWGRGTELMETNREQDSEWGY